MKKRTITYIYILVAICFLSACKDKNKDYDASGIFETTEVIVSAEANGKLLRFDLQEGQKVSFLNPIGYIDTIQLSLKKQQLLANIGAVSSNRMNVSKQVAAIQQQINTQLNEQRRFENLVKSNAANQKQLDDINSQLHVLERQLSAQKEVLENSNKHISGESLSIELQIQQLEDQINKSIIRSPIEGTVLSKYAQQGELVQQGKALFKVADIENMFLRAYMTSNQLTQIKIGQSVDIFSDLGDADRTQHTGTVTWISDKAEFTPKTIQTRDERANLVYAVKIAVKNDGYLKRGMYGELKFAKGDEK